jgi:hypothetical protein
VESAELREDPGDGGGRRGVGGIAGERRGVRAQRLEEEVARIFGEPGAREREGDCQPQRAGESSERDRIDLGNLRCLAQVPRTGTTAVSDLGAIGAGLRHPVKARRIVDQQLRA